jgi:D-sedoheptulose 7-phosphate isomerase
MKNAIIKEFLAHQETIAKVIETMQEPLLEASKLAVETLRNGNKILLCGNGGSAADAQHIAAELTGRYKTERRGLPGIALTTDTSALTAIGNDYGYDRVFDRQVEALANKGDLLIGISTSGNSTNVINALKVAREINAKQIKAIAYQLNQWKLKVIDTQGFGHAEASGGGIRTAEVDNKTYESKLCKGLYFAGEVLDIVGNRGGFNLHFAWASGYLVGKSIIR